ncbi:MAG: phytoene desaturase family protein [Bacteroidales bacterium]
MSQRRAIIIGAGFSGLSAASFLADKGFEVTVLEKNESAGGRARKFESDGFTFDMGPSWYWMPDVFDKFFESFGKSTSDYYTLRRLDPSYRIYWGVNDFNDLPANFESYAAMFESLEKGGANQLRKFLKGAEYKYEVGVKNLVYKKSSSPLEFLDPKLLAGLFKLDVFQSFHKHVRKYFSNPKLLQMVEFPVLFLGGTPQSTPALYSLMNYGDIVLGTWYPEGGMFKIVEGMQKLAESLGARFNFNQSVSEILVDNGWARGVKVGDKLYEADVIVGSADYNHVEQQLLPKPYRNYTEDYWDKRVMSPSSIIFYLGIDKRLNGFKHHTLLFDEDFNLHADEIYSDPKWPTRPSVYISNTSKSDATVAPEGMENLMVLIPVAPGLEDTDEMREKYYDYVITKLEKYSKTNIRDHVVFKRSYAHNDFQEDYNSFKGNAYGLANTLMQTAFLKPKMQSNKVKNLFYAGQLTVPGPGVPPAIISGQVAATEIIKNF